jgi:molybdopterin converting factor small subunit
MGFATVASSKGRRRRGAGGADPREGKYGMAIRVLIPTPLRRFTDGAAAVECSAATLSELLDALTERHPQLGPHLRDASGALRPFVNVYVNEEDIRFLGGSEYRFRDGDEVMLVPSIAGGRPS